ncbi:MAG TPA: histidine ammonia-lyase [Nitriliruptorales bacterium]|nr:histidine ammonia-lyase [Nitriliruptorales bacterium]
MTPLASPADGREPTLETVTIDGGPLLPGQVVAVADRRSHVALADTVPARMAPARRLVDEAVDGARLIYGVTTGFGALADTHISREQLREVQHAILRSHAAGVGPPLPRRVVRAMLLLRARTLAQGHSGVRPAIVQRLVTLLERDLLPVVPEKGSVGASGDLAPFAHLALPLVGEGVLDDGTQVGPAARLLALHGLEPLVLQPKEGLSLVNGTEGMVALGVLGLDLAWRLARVADVACAASVEALLATDQPFQAPIHLLRPHPGQLASAANLARLLDGSQIVASHRDSPHAVQDAYSLRCAPQVHGACRDVLAFAQATFERELGAVVDNPIVLPDTGEVVSAGNFHGQPLGFALDFMTAAVTELGSISERRTDRILDPDHSGGLPPFLARRPGVNSGYMLAQYTAAALVAENRVLCHPASVESIPTSGSQEDHVSMGWGAGRKLQEVLDNTLQVLAVELVCAVEGLGHRSPLRPAPAVAALAAAVRARVPPLEEDRVVATDLQTVADAIRDGILLAAVEQAAGPLR